MHSHHRHRDVWVCLHLQIEEARRREQADKIAAINALERQRWARLLCTLWHRCGQATHDT